MMFLVKSQKHILSIANKKTSPLPIILYRISEKYLQFDNQGLLLVAGRLGDQGEYSGGGRSARPNENFGQPGGRTAKQNENFGPPGGQQHQY
jgi:hypothetical protein